MQRLGLKDRADARRVAEGRTNVSASTDYVMRSFGNNKNVVRYLDDVALITLLPKVLNHSHDNRQRLSLRVDGVAQALEHRHAADLGLE